MKKTNRVRKSSMVMLELLMRMPSSLVPLPYHVRRGVSHGGDDSGAQILRVTYGGWARSGKARVRILLVKWDEARQDKRAPLQNASPHLLKHLWDTRTKLVGPFVAVVLLVKPQQNITRP